MAKGKTKKIKTPSPKKEFRNKVIEQLTRTLTDLEEKLDKKELEARIKKATKLLTAGIKIKPVKQVKSQPVKKDEPVVESKAE